MASRCDEPPAFHCRIQVPAHLSKKNNRPIRINQATRKPFLGKNASLEAAEKWLLLNLLKVRREMSPLVTTPIQGEIHACFHFYFDDFYTKAGVRRKNMPDLSNLCQLPEDCLQKAGIIGDDNQIYSLDGSRRLPGPENVLEIWIWV